MTYPWPHEVEGCFKISNMDTFNVSDAEVLDVVHEARSLLFTVLGAALPTEDTK